MEKQPSLSRVLTGNKTKVPHILLETLSNKQMKTFSQSIADDIKKNPLIWSAAILTAIIIIIVCLCYIRSLIARIRVNGEDAYNNLVRSGFFEKWIIRDLQCLTYNARGVTRPEAQDNPDNFVNSTHSQ